MKISVALLAPASFLLLRAAASTESQGGRNLINGGRVATAGNYPFFVQSFDAYCGGALVAPDLVLTTSSCLPNFVGEVLVGSAKLNGGPDNAQGQWRTILSDVAVHPDADSSGTRDSFALFRIEPVTLDGVLPVALNEDAANPVLGQALTVAGFGSVPAEDDASYYGTTVPDDLMEATVKVADNDVCLAMVQYGGYIVYDEAAMLCTLADAVTGRGPCYGDSGGPLIDANQTLIGITSATSYCSSPYTPSIYSRVSDGYDWIRKTMCRLTADRSALPFNCPDFICPPDGSILGYPSAALPSAANATLSLNGFAPVDIVQVPAAGTMLPANGTTVVTVTGTDASGRTETCDWTVKVPALLYLGGADTYIPQGSQTQLVSCYKSYYGTSGYIHRMEAILVNGPVDGRINATVVATFRTNGTDHEPILTLDLDDLNGTVSFAEPLAFFPEYDATWEVSVTSYGIGAENYATFNLYGQIKH